MADKTSTSAAPRRTLLRLASLPLALAALVQRGDSQEAKKKHRVVFEITAGDEESWTAVLNNVENLQKALGRENTEAEVVAHGKALGLIRRTNTGMQERITAISKTGVRFAACQNTMRRHNVTKEDLLPVAVTVDSGVAQVVRRQGEGWAYIKAGL